MSESCAIYESLVRGFDDPITIAYGASDIISYELDQHIRTCDHPDCVDLALETDPVPLP